MRGVRRALEEQPDLVFLDLRMPDIDGYDVLEQLHADARTRAHPGDRRHLDAGGGHRPCKADPRRRRVEQGRSVEDAIKAVLARFSTVAMAAH
ncbi:MAG: hypothetical protein WDO24_22400 [Pseudomonadota bacterium]